ncbi:hypothetical protein DTO012A7_2199 [Penicillium roqueforti]|nr:hypothetical protein CBS147326_1334 [Penicillium roqueforti]KAI3207972.1 hypothetical protein CBS147311_2293 [Penicillium roqueforti]KAI3243382.1 hypothetical protein DTO012A7_2199 [Penicillium roqueforti]KAI3278473.1 hypothetical protein CBS147309_2672 [Penicillium roqueforti]
MQGVLNLDSCWKTRAWMTKVEKTIGKYPGTLVREYTSYLHAASCQETGNVNCHIARHDDTRCMYYVLRTIVTDPIPLGRS